MVVVVIVIGLVADVGCLDQPYSLRERRQVVALYPRIQ
jgi:hypothetical protein